MIGDDMGSHQDKTAEAAGIKAGATVGATVSMTAGMTAGGAHAPSHAAPMGDPAAEPDIDKTAAEPARERAGDATPAPMPEIVPEPMHTSPGRTNVLQRRLLRRRPIIAPSDAVPVADSGDPFLLLRRIVKQAMSRAAHHECQLPLTVRDTSVAQISLAEVIEKLAPGMFLAMIEGPDDRLGLIALDANMLASCVAMLTAGRVVPGDIAARKPTFTDAALISPILDQFLHLLETGLIDSPQGDCVGGFRFASFLADPRPLSLMLEDQAYQVIIASLDLADGVRDGEWLCAFPDRAPKITTPTADPQPDVTPAQATGPRLSQHVMLCETQLDAILLRRNLTLHDVLAFEPGTLLTLPMSALEEISLQSLDRQVVARGRLGQSKGARAIRITTIHPTAAEHSDPSATAPTLIHAHADRPGDMNGAP